MGQATFTEQTTIQNISIASHGFSDYSIKLTPSDNISVWYSNKTSSGFTINVEESVGFVGTVSWIVTELEEENYKTIPVSFDNIISSEDSARHIQLTPSENIEVWYENVSDSGFDIMVERDFDGDVSWSLYNNTLSALDPTEQSGVIIFPKEVTSQTVFLPIEMENNNYAIQLSNNLNKNIWYTKKTKKSFDIVTTSSVEIATVDWSVHSENSDQNQSHGEVSFTGKYTNTGIIPGFTFSNIPETFILLLQI